MVVAGKMKIHAQPNITQHLSYPLPVTAKSLARCLGLLLCSTNVRVVHLGRKLETRDCLLQMCLQWADHDKHECLGVAAEGVLEEISQLCLLVQYIPRIIRIDSLPLSSYTGYVHPPLPIRER